ncbi:hypothetical protein M5Y63_10665, partial [Neisseria meningitidis]|nr:hypothetical protein [Neisseria meningitidis]MCL4999504.1 hypothetical protein [Neisseria meningitidis]MCL5764656.1 hypothetical protein [Neisseria meningitidis]MCL5917386.1 hypothetical protein [Neisseria meningitidis]
RETVDVSGNHGLGGLLEEGAHGKSPKWLGGNLGDFGEFCKGLPLKERAHGINIQISTSKVTTIKEIR